MKTVVARLQAAQLDGRPGNVRYRQDQLHFLHDALVAQASELCAALLRDTCCTEIEANIEFSMVMATLRHHYETLDFGQSIADEYSVIHGRNNAKNVVGLGIVYVKPTAHSPLYSIISPLVAAIAAGNCVLIEIQQTLATIPGMLQSLLTRALDQDTFAMVSEEVTDFGFLRNGIAILQDQHQAQAPTIPSLRTLQSPAASRTVAIVDRTADLALAARELVAGRFSFSGRSPYAPDLVLVNEFVRKPFLEAAAREAIFFLEDVSDIPKSARQSSAVSQRKRLEDVAADLGGSVVSMGTNACIVDLKQRDISTLFEKVNLPLLAVVPFSSLDDAIDAVNSVADQHPLTGRPYLASYLFANPATAKYLGQFINARASFLNMLPAQLLVGPAHAADARVPLSVAHRYQRAMFEDPRPMFTVTSGNDEKSNSSGNSSEGGQALCMRESPAREAEWARDLLRAAVVPLPPTAQLLQARQVGFFEQGILTGLCVFGAPTVVGVGCLAFFGMQYLVRCLC